MKRALYAGSFDPFTNGHLSIVKNAANLFDEVLVCIAHNPEKVRYTNIQDMKKSVEKTLENCFLLTCKVVVCDYLVADFCRENDVDFLIRGLRNTSDYLYEENIAKINQEINPDLKTIYFRADNEVISSSMIRELLKYNKPIDKYVPKEVLEILRKER